MAVDSGYGRYGYGTLFTNEGIMERKLSEEQKKRAALGLAKASRGTPIRGKSPGQPPSVPDNPAGPPSGDEGVYPEKGDTIIYSVPNTAFLVEGEVINLDYEQRYYKVLVKANRKEEKVWIYRELIKSIIYQPENGTEKDNGSHDYSENHPDISYYGPESTIQGS